VLLGKLTWSWLNADGTDAGHDARRLILWLGCVALLGYLAVAYGYGPLMTSDGDRDYDYAGILITLGFDPITYLNNVATLSPLPMTTGGETGTYVSYIVYIYVLAALRLLADDGWLQALMVVNAVGYACAACLAMWLTYRVLKVRLAVVAVFIFALAAWDYLQFVSMSLSDPMFVAFSTTVVCCAIAYLLETRPEAKNGFLLVAIAVAAVSFFVRPAALPVMAFLGLVVVLDVAARRTGNVWQSLARLFLVVVVCLAAGILLHAFLVSQPDRIPLESMRDWAIYLNKHHGRGDVVLFRPETFTTPPESILGYVRVTLLRIAYFFWFLADDYSSRHVAINLIFFPPFYALVLLGLGACLFDGRVAVDARLAGLLAAIFVLLVAVFHAVTIIDYDWRYRVPTYPAMFLLAAIGLVSVARLVREGRWQSSRVR